MSVLRGSMKCVPLLPPATQDIRRCRPHLKSPGPEYCGSGGEEELQQHQLSPPGAVTSDQLRHREYQDRRRGILVFFQGGEMSGLEEKILDRDFLFPMVKTSLLLLICLCLLSTLTGSSTAKLMMATLPPTQART